MRSRHTACCRSQRLIARRARVHQQACHGVNSDPQKIFLVHTFAIGTLTGTGHTASQSEEHLQALEWAGCSRSWLLNGVRQYFLHFPVSS